MQIKESNEKPNKEEEDVDSESYVMPIFHLPTKAQRKIIQQNVPAQSKSDVDKKAIGSAQKMIAEKSEEKIRASKSKLKSERVGNKADQLLQKKEGKSIRREYFQKEANNKKEIVNQINEVSLRTRKQKRGRPRKQVKIESQVKRQGLQEQPKKMKPQSFQKQTQQKQNEKAKQQGQKMQIQLPQQQALRKDKENWQKQQTKPQNTKVSKVDEKKENNEQQRQQASSSSSDSSSSQSDSSESHRHSKTKKIKMYLTSAEKTLIWKLRYIQCKRKLKKSFFKFKRCLRDHRMRNLVHDPEKNPSKLVCQKCKKDLETICLVYWQCVPCKYLVCAQCQGFNWRKCPYGHPTMKSKHHRGQRTCDICLQQRYVGGLTCPCNFDICGNCELKAKKFNQKGKEVVMLQNQE